METRKNLQRRKQIESLTAEATEVVFPPPTITFDNFRSRLAELIEANFGYSARKSLFWDDHAQDFTWEESKSLYRDITGLQSGVQLVRQFSIDPRKPLVEEFERVRAEHRAFDEDETKVYRALKLASLGREE